MRTWQITTCLTEKDLKRRGRSFPDKQVEERKYEEKEEDEDDEEEEEEDNDDEEDGGKYEEKDLGSITTSLSVKEYLHFFDFQIVWHQTEIKGSNFHLFVP